nr:MAG TPA: hypothetical protein [Caudoviricetes sp.]
MKIFLVSFGATISIFYINLYSFIFIYRSPKFGF